MRMSITSNIRNLSSRLDKRIDDIKTGLRNLRSDITDSTYEYMVDNAPVLTGRFRASIRISDYGDQVQIGPTHRKTRQIVYGSRRTKGAYIALLNRRTGRGYHPGTRPHYFVGITLSQVRRNIPAIVDRNLNFPRMG